MTRPDLAALRALAERATPGPWTRFERTGTVVYAEVSPGAIGMLARTGDWPDAEYIAAAHPQAVIALLDRIDELERALSVHSEHGPDCELEAPYEGSEATPGYPCTCGLDRALERR